MIFKAGGFQLDVDDVVKVATKYCGKHIPDYTREVTGVSLYKGMCEERGLGSLKLITAMKGANKPVQDSDKPYWFHVILKTNLEKDEDEFEYKDVPFDMDKEGMKRVVDIMKEYGFSERDLEDRWVTLSEVNLRYHDKDRIYTRPMVRIRVFSPSAAQSHRHDSRLRLEAFNLTKMTSSRSQPNTTANISLIIQG